MALSRTIARSSVNPKRKQLQGLGPVRHGEKKAFSEARGVDERRLADATAQLAANVKRRRRALRLGTVEAAARGGMSAARWTAIELGEATVHLSDLAKLGRALDVDPAELLQKSTGH